MTITKVEADRIADQAVSLWDRLRLSRDGPSSSDAASEQTQPRLDRWRQVVGKGDPLTFERRLEWEALTVKEARTVLACADAPSEKPPWLEIFVDLIQSVERYRVYPPAMVSRDPDRPCPFEDVLFPLVHAASRLLQREMESRGVEAVDRGGVLLSAQARVGLEVGLLNRLCQVCAPCLQFDFSRFRPVGYSLLNTLVGATTATSTRHYREFVHRLLAANLIPLFERYPVLARLVVVVVENWIAYCAEFLSNLLRDRPLIESFFRESSSSSPGEVVQLRFGLSDSHHRGRSVIGLTFSNGLKLAYKPKSLGIDCAFNQLVRWCNGQGLSLELMTVRILDRPGYGWMEWLDQLPCADAEDAGNFYRRAGMLLALLHVLRCTDCHNENMIARGGHFVLIDGETLAAPDHDTGGNADQTTANEWFWQSVVRTGMLPRWEARLDASLACDITGLGGIGSQATPTEVPRWKNINTDNMDVFFESVRMPLRSNAAMLDGVVLSPCDHVEDLVCGFEETYRLLLRKRTDLLAADGPLATLRNRTVRYVFRPTERYGQILRRSLSPDCLHTGCDHSIELDHLSRAFFTVPAPINAPAVLRAELRALEDMDYPKFEVRTDDTILRYDGAELDPNFFDTTGYSKVLDRLAFLNEADLVLQTRILRASVQAWGAKSEKHVASEVVLSEPADRLADETRDCGESEQRARFLTVANMAAKEIEKNAIHGIDGTVSWLGLTHFPAIGRYQLLPVDDGFYGGRSGIALFLAACDLVNQSEDYRSLILGALQPLRTILRHPGRSRIADYLRNVGIGIAEGTGGLVYSLTCIGEWWQDSALLDDAEILACSISPIRRESDHCLDVIGGAAGAILGLMKLYRVRPSTAVLRIVRDLADRLCQKQRSGGENAGAWDTVSGVRPLTGFAHGASGIACALSQVHSATREPKLLAALRAAIEFEHTAFLPRARNWIDFRKQEPGMPPSCAISWCHGAPGIALARLALLSELKHPLVVHDLEAALATTRMSRPQTADHLCCGSFGRIDILSHAARTLGRKELSLAAWEQAWNAVRQADCFRVAPYDVPGIRNPGLFDGLSGIGYALLRLVDRDRLPCVLVCE